MRTSLLLVALCCGLTLAAGAAASPTDVSPATDDPSPVADNGTDGNDTAVGVCVIGVDSPCNGERWDGNLTPVDDRPAPVDGVDGRLPANGSESADVGICRVGVDSPCNADRWSGLPVNLDAVPGGDLIADTLSRVFGTPA